MKKRIKLIIVLTLILTGFFFQIQSAFALRAPLEDSGAQTISFSVDVSANELTIEKLVTERGDYSIINLPGFELAGNPGEPWLPAVTKNIGIPFDAEYQLTVQGYNPKTVDLGAPVCQKLHRFLEEDYLFLHLKVHRLLNWNILKMRFYTELTRFYREPLGKLETTA